MNYLLILATISLCLPTILCAKDPGCPNMTDYERCQRDAEEDWEVNRNEYETPDKPWCCHQWQAYECQMDLSRKCKKWDKDRFNVSMMAIRSDLEKKCNDFPDDKCHGMKWWAITLIVIGSLLAAALIGFLVFVVFIKRRSSRRYSAPKG